MATGIPTDPKLKAEILDKIRNHGVAVSTVSQATGRSVRSVIYRWLRMGIVDKDRNSNLWRTINTASRKENEQLYKMLGKATAELQPVKRLAVLEVVDPGWRKRGASVLGIARSRLYRTPTVRSERDAVAIRELLQAHEEHPRYGVRRLASELGWSENKARRIRRLAGVTIARRSRKHGKRVRPEIQAPANALKRYAVFRDESKPQNGMDYRGMVNSGAWVQDFTYLWVDRQYHYLAVVLDLKTRQVLGWTNWACATPAI